VQQRMAVARSVAAEDPRRVAQVVRTWVSKDA
jgi:flagellar biosynthesis/type III secretory pathway M-ring protein FliF/YscJ